MSGNPQPPPPFKRPVSMTNQKVKTNQSVTFYRFIAGGFGYYALDFLSKSIFGEGKHSESLKSYQQKVEDEGKNVEFSKEKLLKKLAEHSSVVDLKSEDVKERDASLKNFIYGFIATNLGAVFHTKLNKLFAQKGYNANKKMLLSPFTFLPYYLFCGIYDKLPVQEISSRIVVDFAPLLVVRLIGDLVRHKAFSKAENQAKQAGTQFINNPKLLGYHMVIRGVYIFAMDTLYHKRVQLF